MLALWLERKFTKDEILELYLNRVYFGAGAYGVEAASQRYFGKPATELTLAEAAMLAGLLKAPSRYSPDAATRDGADAPRHRRARTRWSTPEFITDDAARGRDAATSARSRTPWRPPARPATSPTGSWTGIRDLVGEPSEDLVVETTLDLPLQAAAEKALMRRSSPRKGARRRRARARWWR